MKLPSIEPRPDLYDEAERWSVDELRALQLERLQWTVRHAYDNVPHYRKAFERPGRPPRRPALARRPAAGSRSPPRPTCGRTTRSGCSRCRASRWSRVHASQRHDRASPPWSATPRDDLDTWAALMARSIRAAGGRPGDIVHVAYGYGLFTGGLGAHYGAERLGCTVVPVSGGHDRAAGAADHRLRAAGDHGDAVVLPGDPRRDGAARASTRASRRWRSASSAPSRGPTEMRRARSRSGPGCTRSTSTACPR